MSCAPLSFHSLVRTMPALAVAGTLALAGGLAVASTPAAAQAQAIPDGIYSVEVLRVAGAAHGVSLGMTLAFDLTQGEARIAIGCLSYGHATYEANWTGGTWSFTVGDLSTAGCPGANAKQAADVIGVLKAGTAWRLDTTHLGRAPAYVVTGPAMEAILVPAAFAGIDPVTPMAELLDRPAPVPALQGEWQVQSVMRTTASGTEWRGPFGWIATIDPTHITMPRGCNTPGGEDYLATASGAFIMHTGGAYTSIACTHRDASASETLFWALAGARWWSKPTTDTLIFTGPHVQATLVRPDPGTTAPWPDTQAIPNGVYEVGAWEAVDGSSQSPASRLRLALVDGVAQWAGGCLPLDAFTYSAPPDGRWRFEPRIRADGACPGEAALAAAIAIERLTSASAWSLSAQPGAVDTYLLATPSAGSLTLYRHPHLAVPDAGLHGDLAPAPAMQGTWRVAAIVPAPSAGRAGSGPYAWTLTIDPARITLPPGCGTSAGEAYATTSTGAFAMRAPAVTNAMACTGERDESSTLFSALADATRWASPTTDTLILTGQDTEVRLERASPADAAFAVKAIRPAIKTVRLAVGQSAKVAIAADPLAPGAVATATIRWTNSRGAVARVTRTASEKKAAKSGSIAVPMNTAKTVRLTITGAKKGTSRLTLAAPSGVQASIKIIVVAKRVKPTAVTVTGAVNAWTPDGTMRLGAKVRPAKATGAVPRWSSSDPSLVSVDDHGVVTLSPGVNPGAPGTARKSVTITVKAGTAKGTRVIALP